MDDTACTSWLYSSSQFVVISRSRTPTTTITSFFCNTPSTTGIYTLSLHDALPIFLDRPERRALDRDCIVTRADERERSEEHTSELQSRGHLVCRLLLEKKKHSISP